MINLYGTTINHKIESVISSNFNEKVGILEVKFFGDVSCNEIADYINATKLNPDYPRFLRILTDATEANMVFGHNDIQSIVDANNESLKNYEYIVDALIVEKSLETALTAFFSLLAENEKYKAKIFSTYEAANYFICNANAKNII